MKCLSSGFHPFGLLFLCLCRTLANVNVLSFQFWWSKALPERIRALVVCGAAAISLFSSMPRDCLAVQWTIPSLVNADSSPAVPNSGSSTVATDGQGTWIVAWSRNSATLIARSHDFGSSWDGPTTISTTLGARVLYCDGATWLLFSAANLNGDTDIEILRSTDGGQTWAGPIFVNNDATTDTASDDTPCAVSDGNGSWVALWSRQLGSSYTIQMARSTDGGLGWTSPALLADTPSKVPAITRYGQTLVASFGQGDPDTTQLKARRSTNFGVNWSAAQTLATVPGGAMNQFFAGATAIALDSQANCVAFINRSDVRIDNRQETHLLCVRSTDAGASWAPAVEIGNTVISTIYPPGANPRALWAPGFGFIKLQTTIGTQLADLSSFASTDGGATWPTDGISNSFIASPDIAVDSSGRAISVWTSTVTLTGRANVYFSRSNMLPSAVSDWMLLQ